MKKIYTFFILISLISYLTSISSAQVNFEPVNNSVYGFLERMSQKGLIQTNEEILPFSRMYIAERLQKIVQNSEFRIQNSEENALTSLSMNLGGGRMSGLEKEELEFYIREFSSELKKLDFDLTEYEVKKKLVDLKSDNFGFDKYNRFRLLSYDKADFGLFIDPVISYNYEMNEGQNSVLWSNGLKLYGNFGASIGFNLEFFDNHYSGDYFYRTRKFSPLTGYEFNINGQDYFDFDRMNANVSFGWDWGSFTIGKDFNYYGSGENGKIILSDKAPSFPYIKLEVNHSDWFRFSYIHGYLNSQVIDSSTIRKGPLRDHFSKVEKYFVTHMISFTPYSYLNLSLGESVVYSDKFEPIYLIPVAFFRLADHYLTDPDESAGNAQLFASLWYKNYWSRTKLYASIFVDELSLGNSDNPKALAFNIGFKSVDPLIPESELVFEYTKIEPFNYFHADQAQTYENYGYQLGHWIGSNADQLYLSFNKRILRGLNLKLNYSYIRKGNEESFDEARYQDYQTFLWGDENNITQYGAELNYELIHSLKFSAKYNYSDEKLKGKLLVTEGSFISFGFSYGM